MTCNIVCVCWVRQGWKGAGVYLATSYGADPTGQVDSTEALLAAMADAANGGSEGWLMEGVRNVGGAQLHLQGGNYLITRPLRFPVVGVGNLMVRASSF